MNLSWMMWIWQTSLFFIFIFAAIVYNGVMGARYPVVERKGFLPIATTPGDRLFIGLVFGLAIILLWLAFIGYAMLWFGALLTLVWFVVVFKWG